MNRISAVLASFCLVLLTSFKSDNALTTFKGRLERSGMAFEMPKGFAETAVITNKQMSYDYAIKHVEKQFEVRFAVRPLGDLIKKFNELEKNKEAGDVNINPNKLYATSLQATVFSTSGGRMPQINQFSPEAVKAEFNADWGATTIFEVGKEFGRAYKYCMVVAIHKDGLADAYCFYLSDKQETVQELMGSVFHNLKFK